MYPWISRTLDFWLQFCKKKCGLYMDVYGIIIIHSALYMVSIIHSSNSPLDFSVQYTVRSSPVQVDTTGDIVASLISKQ